MTLTQSDGFPITFNLHKAAMVSGITTSTLRSYLHREILRHVGQTPLAGQERRFTLTGLIEVALVSKFASAGISLQLASRFADAILRQSFAHVRSKDIGQLNPEQKFSLSEYMKLIHDPKHNTAMFDANPRYFMNQPMWSNRDLLNPFFVLARNVESSGGVSNVAVSVVDLSEAGKLAKYPEVVHVLNLTRLMIDLEAAIEAK